MILRVRYTRVNVLDDRWFGARVRVCRNECLAIVPDKVDDTVSLAFALLEAIFDVENVVELVEHGLYVADFKGVRIYCNTPCNDRGLGKSLPSMTGAFNGYTDYVLVDVRLVNKQPSLRVPRRLRILARCEPYGWTMLLDDGELSEVVVG